jgi:hypothetical protein
MSTPERRRKRLALRVASTKLGIKVARCNYEGGSIPTSLMKTSVVENTSRFIYHELVIQQTTAISLVLQAALQVPVPTLQMG